MAIEVAAFGRRRLRYVAISWAHEPAWFQVPSQGQNNLGHTKIESTVRYLGVEIDDAIEIAEKIDV
jgi:hypothetical protein